MKAGWILSALAILGLALLGAMPGRAKNAPSAVVPHGWLVVAPGVSGH